MLEQNARILLVDTDGVLDGGTLSSPVDEGCIHIVNRSFAITTQGKTVGHISSTIFAQVESMLPLMRMFRISIWHNHLRQR